MRVSWEGRAPAVSGADEKTNLHMTVMALLPVLCWTLVTSSTSSSREEAGGRGLLERGQLVQWNWVTVKEVAAAWQEREGE